MSLNEELLQKAQHQKRIARQQEDHLLLARMTPVEQIEALRIMEIRDDALVANSQLGIRNRYRISTSDSPEDSRLKKAQGILTGYGVKLVAPKPGKKFFLDSSQERRETGGTIDYVLASDLSPGEGGFTTAWSVGAEATVDRVPAGTICIPIWRDQMGELNWDTQKVAEYLSE